MRRRDGLIESHTILVECVRDVIDALKPTHQWAYTRPDTILREFHWLNRVSRRKKAAKINNSKLWMLPTANGSFDVCKFTYKYLCRNSSIRLRLRDSAFDFQFQCASRGDRCRCRSVSRRLCALTNYAASFSIHRNNKQKHTALRFWVVG